MIGNGISHSAHREKLGCAGMGAVSIPLDSQFAYTAEVWFGSPRAYHRFQSLRKNHQKTSAVIRE